jgi:hypothetical protein
MSGLYDFKIFPVKDALEIINSATGNNQKGLLVIIPANEDTEEGNTFANKILKAAGFSIPDDILLLKLTEEDRFSLISVLSKADISNIIVFGFKPSFLGLNWNLPTYHPYPYNERNFLFADSLIKIMGDVKLKGQLWKCLQLMFLS